MPYLGMDDEAVHGRAAKPKLEFKKEMKRDDFGVLVKIRAFQNGWPVGEVSVYPVKKGDRLQALISGLKTHGKRNTGIGTALLEQAEAASRKIGAKLIELHSDDKRILSKSARLQSLRDFYQKRGYKPYYRKDKKTHQVKGTNSWRMVKLVKTKPPMRARRPS